MTLDDDKVNFSNNNNDNNDKIKEPIIENDENKSKSKGGFDTTNSAQRHGLFHTDGDQKKILKHVPVIKY